MKDCTINKKITILGLTQKKQYDTNYTNKK